MATILITGSNKGIGMAAAIAFGKAGHNVAATMRNPALATELMNSINSEKLPIKVFQLDVDLDESVSSTIQKITKEMGPIDVLVNNAGVGIPSGVAGTPEIEKHFP